MMTIIDYYYPHYLFHIYKVQMFHDMNVFHLVFEMLNNLELKNQVQFQYV